jgi:hypothetical protein
MYNSARVGDMGLRTNFFVRNLKGRDMLNDDDDDDDDDDVNNNNNNNNNKNFLDTCLFSLILLLNQRRSLPLRH